MLRDTMARAAGPSLRRPPWDGEGSSEGDRGDEVRLVDAPAREAPRVAEAEREVEQVAERDLEPQLAADPRLELRRGGVVERAPVVDEGHPADSVEEEGQRRRPPVDVEDREAVLGVEEAVVRADQVRRRVAAQLEAALDIRVLDDVDDRV